ncbi:MAG: hypothetical protein NC300_09195 [Bacteroidales bacterium]|nr:hypothetical protein [Clostridium sp.]MCM1204305.1 hypothetical protein [Bacteroidales bacterium]
MHLSDAYEHRENQHALDLTCIVYNINPGYNRDIKKESRVISGYTAFVEKVRFHAKKEKTLKDAIERAVDECIQENILAEFFRERRREVVNVAALDFTFERREKLIRRDSLEEGWEKGREEGQKSGEERVILQMYEKGLSIEQIADITDRTTEEIKEILQHNKKYPA